MMWGKVVAVRTVRSMIHVSWGKGFRFDVVMVDIKWRAGRTGRASRDTHLGNPEK